MYNASFYHYTLYIINYEIVISFTSVTLSVHPSITTAGLWVVMMIWIFGFSFNTRPMSCFCHSK